MSLTTPTKTLKQSLKFTKTALEALQPTDARQTVYDELVAGLALRISPSGHKSFYYYYRAGKGRNTLSKKIQLGAFPEMTPEQARLKARQLAAQVVSGQDPARELKEAKEAQTVAQVLKIFMDEYAAKLKANTRIQYEGLARLYILPHLGTLKLEAVTHRDIARLHHELRERPAMANRAAALLSVFFNWCISNGYRERGSNPVPGLKKFKEKKRVFHLNLNQIKAIWAALADLEQSQNIPAPMAAAMKLLMLTGARKNEILGMKWADLNLEAGSFIAETKTGPKEKPLSPKAVAVLKSLPKWDAEYVFPSFKPGAKTPHVSELRWSLLKVLAKAGIEGRWRVHDLRHAYASAAANSGAGLPIVGAMLGHSQPSVTAGYIHIDKDPIQELAEKMDSLITEGEGQNTSPAGQGPAADSPQPESVLH